MASVTFENVTISYPGAREPSVRALDLAIADGEFLVLVGPSGCGKSTTMRALAGLEEVTGGRVLIGERDVTDLEPKDRDVAMVFQNYALYPHMTVAENMGFALKLAKRPKAEIVQRVRAVAEMLDLGDFLDRKPKALSGGQRQRVAMGRAIVREPQVFLMDEPLSNLDAKLRVQTRTQISQMQRRLGVTTVYVTHDQVEAMTMGDRVAVLKDGVLQQVAAPRELYERPANVFVAGFIGSPAMNLWRLPVGWERGGRVAVRLGAGRVHVDAAVVHGRDEVVFGIRPEHVAVVPAGTPEGVDVHVDLVEALGADSFVYGTPVDEDDDWEYSAGERPAGEAERRLVVRLHEGVPPAVGETVTVLPDPERVHLFDAETGRRLG